METSESEKQIYKLSNEYCESVCDLHRRELSKLKDTIGKKERKIKELETRTNEFKQNVHNKEQVIKKMEKQIQEYEKQISKQHKPPRMGMTYMQELDKLKKEHEIQTSEFKKNINQKEQDIKKMERTIQEYEKQLRDFEKKADIQEQDNNTIQKYINEIDDQIQRRDAIVKNLQTEISEYKKVIQDKDEQFERERNDSKYCLKQHKEKITKDIKTIETQKEEITELKRRLSTTEKEFEQLTMLWENNNKTMEEYKQRMLAAETGQQQQQDTVKFMLSEIDKLNKSLSQTEKALQSEEDKIKKLNTNIEKCESSLSQKEKALQSAEDKIKKLNTNIEEYKSSLSQKEKALQSAENKIKKLNTNIEEYKSREETEIMRYQEMVSEKDIVIRDTKKRLTEAAQVNLASGHHTRVENTEFIVRPSTLAADYNEFTDGQRMDAIDLLQKKTKCDELASELIACEIMKVTHSKSSEMCVKFKTRAKALLSEPVMCAAFKNKQCDEHMVDFDGMINTGLKRTAHNCDISPIVESTTDWVIKFAKDKKLDVGKNVMNELKEYISMCARLAWGMVAQTPPLTLEYGYKPKYIPTQHELSGIQRESITSSTVLTYIWPILKEQDDGRVMCKGILTPERAITKRRTSLLKY